MLPVELALVLALLIVCCFTPGFFLVRRLPWTPLEKLCGAIGLSLVLIYLAAWGVYCFGPRDERGAFLAMAAVALLLGAAAWRDIRWMLRCFRVRQALAGYGFLLLLTVAMLSMIRVYSGAGWAGDWYEHFHRSLFFLHRLPAGVTIYPMYPLPARPPLMNVVAAFFLGLTRDEFPIFQVIFGFLNLLVFLPCLLILPALGSGRRRAVLPLTALFAASPVVMQAATYTWTKSLTAFFVVLALALYLAAWRKRDSRRTVAAFVALAAGLLAHYSAGPYIALLALHYLARFFRDRPRRWRELATIAVACGLLLGTWFGWSARVYGIKTTLASNTSVTPIAPYQGSNLEKVGANLFDTLVPASLRGVPLLLEQGNAKGILRDHAFVFYQLNLIFAMGIVGGPLVLWLLWRKLVRGKRGRERTFWLAMVPFCVVLGVAVVGERDTYGVPHLTLLTLEALGIALLAANFRNLPRAVCLLVVAGCLVDFSLGVFLHARVESLENTPGRTVFPELRYSAPDLIANGTGPDSLTQMAWITWSVKHRAVLYPKWLAELPRGHENDPAFQMAFASAAEFLRNGLRDDAVNWGGWEARHGGVEHLGDWVAGPSGRGVDVAAAVFALLFLALMGGLARQALKPVPAVAPAPLKVRGVRAGARRAGR